MTIEWNEDLKLGVEKIDHQHRAFFEQRNKFMAACTELLEEKDDPEVIRKEIDELFYFLTDYFLTHFNDEEEILKEADSPYYEEHKKHHQEFIKEVKKIKYDFLENEEIDIKLIRQLKDKITAWFVNHISKDDKKVVQDL